MSPLWDNITRFYCSDWFWFEYVVFVVAVGMVTINLMIDEDNYSALLGALQSSDVALNSVTQECVEGYSTKLREAKQEKAQSK